MKKKITLHIFLDLLAGWLLNVAGIIWGIKTSVLYIIGTIPLILWYGSKTIKWATVAFDILFSTTCTRLTKGYRYTYRERVYSYRPKSIWHYSVVMFDDVNLKGKYVFLDEAFFRHGEKLIITYYPRSKYIVSIAKQEHNSNCVVDDHE